MSKPATRILDRLDRLTMPIPFSGCMVYLGFVSEKPGYVRCKHKGRTEYAHRAVYEEAHGPIPEGLQINHLCEVKSCLNPLHLEAVTRKENARYSYRPEWNSQRSKTHCKRGHELSGDNLYQHKGRRHCKACRAAHDRQTKARRKTVGPTLRR